MSKQSDEFEQLIAEIYTLLNTSGSIITWNDSIKDPDNPSQTRQVDITLRTGDKITHIECRIHQSKQDVKWIEELHGRRMSLNADYMIGVSSSGFTEGAIKKAARFGILLKDMRQLSKEDILSWTQAAQVKMTYVVFDKANFNFSFPSESAPYITFQKVVDFFQANYFFWVDIFHKIIPTLYPQMKPGETYTIRSEYIPDSSYQVNGQPIIGVLVTLTNLREMVQIHDISEAFLFGSPEDAPENREVNVQNFPFKQWQLIDTPVKGKFKLNLANFEQPNNAYLLDNLTLQSLTSQKKYDVGLWIKEYISPIQALTDPTIQISFTPNWKPNPTVK